MKILIPYDGSEPAKAAIADLARAGLPDNIEATVLSVADVWLPPSESSNGETRVDSVAVDHARAKALSLLEEARMLSEEGASIARHQFPRWSIRNEAAADSPAWAVIKRSGAADLVVIGARGQSPFSRLIFGSVSQKVVIESECSVRIGRKGKSGSGPVRVLVGIDGSSDAQSAIAEIKRRLWPEGSEIRVLTSIDSNIATAAAIPGAPIANWMEDADENETVWVSRMLDAACASIERPGLKVSSTILEGDPKVALIEEADAWSADVIFVGARGHSLMERLMLGSVSSAIAIRAHCSVEIVRRTTATS
jgi:nucleotide-binding universal stress UspA family protein